MAEKVSKSQIKDELISTMYVSGIPMNEIAEKLNMHPNTVERYINGRNGNDRCKNLIAEKFANIQDEGMKKIKENYIKAIDQMLLLMNQDEDLSLKFKASQYIIECVAGKPAQKSKIEASVETNVTTINVNITDEE